MAGGDFGYKNIRLLKNDKLGDGSYGTVCKAKCDELICAAKVIHKELVEPAQGEVSQRGERRHPVNRFEQECEFLSTLKHPNIIQYLGTWTDPESGQLVLLMELLDTDLTSFLENASSPLPFHKQVDVCYDIALALAFLHSNNIAHRDLSGKNILMIGDCVRAKVTDFGMATLIEKRPVAATTCPGCEAYMPPEALQTSSLRHARIELEKIDVFSFGVIILQILTRKFPNPGQQKKLVEEWRLGRPNELVLKSVPELERRKEHIEEVDSTHPLQSVFRSCLKDHPRERPSAKQLCERLAKLKQSSQYSESAASQDLEASPVQSRPRRRGLRESTQKFLQNAEELKFNMAVLEKTREIKEKSDQSIQVRERAIIERDKIIDKKDMELQMVHGQCEQLTIEFKQLQAKYEQQSNSLKEITKEQATQEKLSEAICEKDAVVLEKEMELQRVGEQLRRRTRQCERLENELKQIKDENVSRKKLVNSTVDEKHEKIIHEKEQELIKVKEQLKVMETKVQETRVMLEEFDSAIRKKDDIINEKEQELQRINKNLEQMNALYLEQKDELKQVKEELCKIQKNDKIVSDTDFVEIYIPPDILEGALLVNTLNSSGADSAIVTSFNSTSPDEEWRCVGSIPHSIDRKNSEVVINSNTLYIANGRSTTIEAANAYNLDFTNQSGTLPSCPQKDFSLAIVDGLLTTVGGSRSSKKLFSLCYSGEDGVNSQRKWMETFPSMPTGRQWATTLYTDRYLVVAGGCIQRCGRIASVLSNVEVMDIRNRQWSVAANLPEPLYLASGTICGDTVFVGGGMGKDGNTSTLMYTCTLASLVKTSRPIRKPTEFKVNMWDKLTNLPGEWSTCVSVGSCLLAVGGTYCPAAVDQSESSLISSTAMSKVYRYNQSNRSWEVVSFMLSPRIGCFAVKRSEHDLMVLGGGDKTVEIAENILSEVKG